MPMYVGIQLHQRSRRAGRPIPAQRPTPAPQPTPALRPAARLPQCLGALALLATLALLAIGCGGDSTPKATPTHTDPQNLVRYAAPEGWMERRTPSRVRYTPGGSSEDPTILGIEVEPSPNAFTPEEYMEQLDGKHEQQEHLRISDARSSSDEFEIYEAVYEGQTREGNAIYHQVMLFSDELQVSVYLNAPEEVYEEHLPQLRRVVDSVVPAP